MQHENGSNKKNHATTSLLLKARPERRLIRSSGSKRAIDFHIQVEYIAGETEQQRLPLKLALVLDRSGSMQGEKIQTAKSAALAVIDQLTLRDKVAVVIFDDRIDVVQELAPATRELKGQLRRSLASIQARANTALHEGWLTGCKGLAADVGLPKEQAVARCFLLTDGLANVGITDPEHIASEAAGIQEHTGISTSTFGIGNDYNELLLGPMAVAGGGQFHHLRTADEITRTFVGELGSLLAIAARQVRLELEVEPGVSIDLISAYWESSAKENTLRRSINIGDLQRNEEQHVVIRFGFPEQEHQEQRVVRARLVWLADDSEKSTDWQEIRFSYASHSACDDEPQDADVMRQVGLQEVDRARREAIRQNNRGDLKGARSSLAAAAQAVASYAGSDQVLQDEIGQLHNIGQQMASAPMAPGAAKEMYYQQHRRSRSKADYRSKEPEPEKTTEATQSEKEPDKKTEPEKKEAEKKKDKKWPWQ